MVSRQRLWQLKVRAEGRCANCGKKRPKRLKVFCRVCQDLRNASKRTMREMVREIDNE